jgi:hypothetical protein
MRAMLSGLALFTALLPVGASAASPDETATAIWRECLTSSFAATRRREAVPAAAAERAFDACRTEERGILLLRGAAPGDGSDVVMRLQEKGRLLKSVQ